MYQVLIVFHSFFRWLVLASLLLVICRSFTRYRRQLVFSKADNELRHWTATIAHIQLVLGISLYTQSPLVRYFWNNFNEAAKQLDTLFFGLIHIAGMLLAVILITVGSAMAKRKETDKEKFRTLLTWFLAALIIILIVIPWPFSPLASRPYFR